MKDGASVKEVSIKDKLREIYNAEIDFLQKTTEEKNKDKDIIKLFVSKIDDVLNPGRFFERDKTKETKRDKKIDDFLDFYQKKLPRYDTDHKDGNPDHHGTSLAGALVELREKLKPGKDFEKEEWIKLKGLFKKSEKEIGEDIKYVNAQIPGLETSRDKINAAKDDDKKLNEKLAEILLQDFKKDDAYKTNIEEKKEEKEKKTQPIYSNFFYVDIDRAISVGSESNAPKPEFKGVAADIETRVADVKQKIKKIDDIKTDTYIEYLTTKKEEEKLNEGQIKKLEALAPQKTVIESGASNGMAERSIAGGDTGVSPSSTPISEGAQIRSPGAPARPEESLESVVSGGQQGGSAIESVPEAKQEETKQKEIFEKQVTVGTEVATIGGVALLGAVTIGTGGLILPIAVVAATAVGAYFAVVNQKEGYKQVIDSKKGDLLTNLVDIPSEHVTKRILDSGRKALKSLSVSEDKKGEEKGIGV
jgi:hypothetical protein